MKTYTIAGVVGWIIALAVAVVLWVFVMVAVMHVFGCSLTVESGELTGIRHHHNEDDDEPTPAPTPDQRTSLRFLSGGALITCSGRISMPA